MAGGGEWFDGVVNHPDDVVLAKALQKLSNSHQSEWVNSTTGKMNSPFNDNDMESCTI